ncbi:hypothetical protein GCM10020295_79370 [Streptomyces cinereospinus]
MWLEPTPTARITRLDMTPDLPSGTLRIIPRAVNAAGRSARVTVSAGGTVVGTATGAVGSTIAVPVPNARLWSPDDPFLYDVRVDLLDGGGAVADTVGSYAGMRSVSIGMVNGTMRTLLNGRPVFMNGVLDQGYWPDGNMTAPPRTRRCAGTFRPRRPWASTPCASTSRSSPCAGTTGRTGSDCWCGRTCRPVMPTAPDGRCTRPACGP